MSFTDVFSNEVVSPSDVGYNGIVITTSPLQLDWPNLATSDDNVVARIIEISSALVGAVAILPDAREVSTGEDVLFKNVGAGTIQIQTNGGGALLSLASGEVKYIYLTDSSTAAGTWTVIAFGVGVGTLDASQLAGFGLKAIANTLNTAHPVSAATVSFTIQTSDRARVYNFTGGAATLSLQTASAYGDNFFFGVTNSGSGAITIDPAGTETIDGAVSIDINPGESALVMTNGSLWVTVGRGRSVNFNFTQLVKDVSGNTDVTLTTTEASNKVLKFIGALTGNINVNVPNVVSLYIVDNETTGAFTLTVKTAAGTGIIVPQANRNILYSDGTNVLQAVTVSVAATTFGDGTAASPSITFGSDTDTGIYRAGTNTLGFTTGGTLRESISTTAITNTLPIRAPDGAVGAPSYSFSAATDTGVYRTGGGVVTVSVSGVDKVGVSSTLLTSSVAISIPDGTVGAPGLRWTASGTTGLFSSADNTVRVTCNGIEIATFASTSIMTPVQVISTLATGTPPFVVASTTNVANLNASSLGGATFASPGPIGSTIPDTGAFTTLAASGNVTMSGAAANRDLTISSGNAANYAAVNLGRTVTEIKLAVANGGGSFVSGSVAGDGVLVANGATNLVFGTNSIQAFKIATNQHILVNLASDRARLSIDQSASVANLISLNDTDGGAANQIQVSFLRSGVTVGSISTTNTLTAYNTSSDYRLKNELGRPKNAVERVLKLNPVRFTFKHDTSNAELEGFMAHEVQDIVPGAVTGVKDGKEYQGVDYSKLVPLLTAALQDALFDISMLKSTVARLAAINGVVYGAQKTED